MENKLWYYGKNISTMKKSYGAMKKTMVLYRKLWNFDLLWYYGQNYSTIVNYSTIKNYSSLY